MKKVKKVLKTRRIIAFLVALVMLFGFMPKIDLRANAAAPTSYTDINPGSSASVSITSSGGAQYFRFVPSQSGDYTFYSDNNSGSSYDTYVYLLDSSGNVLEADDDDGTNNNFSLTYSCTAGTTYYIKAAMWSSNTGSYTLHVSTWSPSSYTNISAGGSASVSITSSGGAKYFRFVPSQSGDYTFYSSNYSGDPYVYLLNASGSQLSYNDDGGANFNFSLTYSCTAGTTYYIKAAMHSSNTGSYTLHVSSAPNPTPDPTPDPIVPEGDCVDINVAGGTNYPLFNSGRTGSPGYSSDYNNSDDSSYTNDGYDLYASMGGSTEIIQLGLPFVIGVSVNEQATVNIYAYDVDEYDTYHGHGGHERDYVYLVNETTGERTKLGGYLTGQNSTWNNTSLTISSDLLEVGNRYHFELDVDCTCGCGTFWVVYIRTVNLIINGSSDPTPTPNTGIENADLEASISSSGLVSVSLTANAYSADAYTLEYKAVCVADNSQYGGKEYSVTIPATSTVFDTTFQLESGAQRGTYEITVFIKDSAGNVIATRNVTASYGYSAVSYNSNGGSQNLPTDGTTYSNGDTVTVKFDYIPSMYGYTFLGWSTDRDATEPTYTENGVNTFTIGSSDVVLYAVWQLEVCDHDFVLERVYEATCCQEGENVYVCSICGEFLSEPIPQLEHNFVEGTIVRYPTCTEEGLKEVDKCDLPGCTLAYIQALESIPALGHDYVNGVCSRCGDVRNGKVLLIEDILPWDSDANSIVLQDLVNQGKIGSFEKHSSIELANGTVDVYDYALVVLAADQEQSFYNNIPIETLMAYAQSGGSLFVAADTAGHTSGVYQVFPFGIRSLRDSYRNNYIVDFTHPMITGEYSDNHVLQDGDMYGEAMSHNYFTNYPANANVILKDSNNNPTLIEFEYGQGMVIVSGLTFECGYMNDWNFAQGYDDIFVYLYNCSSNIENNPHTHSFIEVHRTDATCTTDGIVVNTCSLCGEDEEIAIPKLGHDYVSGICSRCGEEEYSADVWDGSIDTSWYNSADTEFTIYTAEQLAGLACLVNNGNTFSGKTIYLGNNIDLANREWTPIGESEEKPFSGTFDGRYYVVSNLSLEKTAKNSGHGIGFFGTIQYAIVRNTGIENAEIVVNGGRSGIICGVAKSNTLIESCYTTGSISIVGITNSSGGVCVGGFVGDMQGGEIRIRNCYTSSRVISTISKSDLHIGGFVGFVCANGYDDNYRYGDTKYIENCYSNSTVVTNTSSKGGLIGELYYGTLYVNNSFDNSTINGFHYQSFIGTLSTKEHSLYTENVYYNELGTSSYGGTPTSVGSFQSQSWIETNLGWDFDTVWEFNGSSEYPVLQGFGNANPNPPHEHSYAEVSRTEETCTTDGLVEYACSCGATRVEIIPAHGHNIETTVETEVSCTTDGLIVDRCTNTGCDYERATVIHGEHNYSITDSQEATCDTPGYIEYTCSNCGNVNVETIEAGMHNYVESSRVEPQVEVEGSITYTCTICHDSYSIVIPALLPVLKNSAVLLIQDSLPWAEDVNSTLLEVLADRGVVSYYNIINTSALASYDLSQYGVVFIANDQSTAMYNRLAANSDKLENYVRAGGNLIYGACDEGWGGCGSLTHALPGGVASANYYSVHNYIVNELHPIVTGVYTDNRSLRDELLKGNYCSHTYFNANTLPADANIILRDANGNPTLVEYNLGEGTVIASGLTWEYFYVRNHYGMATNYSKYVYDDLVTYMVYMSNTCEHSYEIVETVDPTCEENGYTKYVCTLCAYEYMGDIVVAPGHQEGDWIIDLEPTCGETGLKHTECIDCGHFVQENVSIPATGEHEESDWIIDLEPTCGETGLKHTECIVCGHPMQVDVLIPATGEHVESDWIIDLEPTCGETGLKHTECIVCGHPIQVDVLIPATGEHVESDWIIDLEPTCTQDGLMHTECLVCGHPMQVGVSIPATGHSESDWIIDRYATCLENGSKHTECFVCGGWVREEIIYARGYHVEGDWIIDVEPTCTTDGQKHTECVDCGNIVSVEPIPALGHDVSDWIIEREATATTPGWRYKECLRCGLEVDGEEISVLAKIKIADVTASVGSVVEVAVSVENNPGVLGAVLTIDYDTELELISARAGNAWTMLTLTNPAYYTSPCNFVWDGVSGADTSDGDIIILTFRVSDSARVGSVYGVRASYTSGNLLNGSLESIDMDIHNGSVEIDVIKGDVNSDGTVDVADVVALRRYLAGGYNVTIEWIQSDIDEDGMITVADVVLLRRYIVNGQF